MKPIRKKNLVINHDGQRIEIKLSSNGYFCLNDMARLFPKKQIRDWLKLKRTQEAIEFIKQHMGNYPYPKPIYTIKGKGTYVCRELAITFAMWCSIEFQQHVIKAYMNSLDWEETRELTVLGNSFMTEAINYTREDPQPRHFMNEARLLNKIVFIEHAKDIRDTATLGQLELLKKLELYNGALIMSGLDYQQRKPMLFEFAEKLS